ncbi:MAG: type II CRISPR-associated endonuclease Cas1 [Phycisphaeraceae bacterium]|nr:type II CRISPR-associated endonuclease Cas1 [Phycisphaeraceae bacterium]MBX3407572.1 type II CRISPR-associated endonuclease Cas1 [Phycisphaeraceae bacterium]
MIRRAVEISRDPCSLVTRDEQLLVLRRDGGPPKPLPAHPANLAGSIPCEDLGLLIVDERDTTYTHGLLAKLAEHGAALVVCGRDHIPIGVYAPLPRNTDLLARLDAQIAMSKPVRKRLWSRIVAAKIRAQARNLAADSPTRARLLGIARSVRSGDPDNREAYAAMLYWPALFEAAPGIPRPFRRQAGDPTAAPPNNLLDYGYAVLRAALARAIVAAGLLPALGLRHIGRSNFFCLADDLVEPLRPFIDARVVQLVHEGRLRLNQDTKADLIKVLWLTVQTGEEAGPLQIALAHYVASLVRCLEGDPGRLQIPVTFSAPGAADPNDAEDVGETGR